MTHRLLKEQKAVTAIFASNSSMSCGSLLALTEAGISVPDDMAFISCGRLYGNYQQISSVVYPAEAIGEECASILLEKMSRNKRKGKRTSKRVTFSMQLLLRGSEVYPLNRAPGKRNLDMAKSNTYR